VHFVERGAPARAASPFIASAKKYVDSHRQGGRSIARSAFRFPKKLSLFRQVRNRKTMHRYVAL